MVADEPPRCDPVAEAELMFKPFLEICGLTRPEIDADLPRLIPGRPAQIGWLVLLGVLVLTYAAQMARIFLDWLDPDYQYCFFVPVFSLLLLWHRRRMAIPLPERGSWWGIPFLVLWAAIWWASAFLSYNKTVPLSLVPFLLGVTLLLGGWRAFRWAWPAIVFLVFMVPLPEAYSHLLRQELQLLATKLSVFAIQTLGIPSAAQGNVIRLPGGDLEVAQACSGLCMLMLFFAVCVGAAFVLRRPVWQRITAVVSAVPIAVLANVIRLTLAAVGHHWFGAHVGEAVHDWAGLMMMVVGLLLLWGEMALLDLLFVEPPPEEAPLVLGDSRAPKASGPGG